MNYLDRMEREPRFILAWEQTKYVPRVGLQVRSVRQAPRGGLR